MVDVNSDQLQAVIVLMQFSIAVQRKMKIFVTRRVADSF